MLGALLPELWDTMVEAIVDALPQTGVVTLIPIGALVDLPLHAAIAAPGADGLWRDRVDGLVLRYAPNARVLLQARAVADAASAPEDLRLLSVDGPGLPDAIAEREAVLALVPPPQRVRPEPATVANVLAALGEAASGTSPATAVTSRPLRWTARWRWPISRCACAISSGSAGTMPAWRC